MNEMLRETEFIMKLFFCFFDKVKHIGLFKSHRCLVECLVECVSELKYLSIIMLWTY